MQLPGIEKTQRIRHGTSSPHGITKSPRRVRLLLGLGETPVILFVIL